MTPLDLKHRLSAIEPAIALLASQDKNLLPLMIDVLQRERCKVLAVDDERYAFALLDELKKACTGVNKMQTIKAPN